MTAENKIASQLLQLQILSLEPGHGYLFTSCLWLLSAMEAELRDSVAM